MQTLALCTLATAVALLYGCDDGTSPASPGRPLINFDQALETDTLAPVCPIEVLDDRRQGYGADAALEASMQTLGREDALAHVGCAVWRAGQVIDLSPEQIVRAKRYQSTGKCGWLLFGGPLLPTHMTLSCYLRNAATGGRS